MATMPAAVPRRPHVALTLRLPPELHASLAALAQREDRSLTSLVTHVLREWAAQQGGEREYPRTPLPTTRVAEGEGPPYRPGGV